MSLPMYRQILPASPGMNSLPPYGMGSPLPVNILKDRLRANLGPGGSGFDPRSSPSSPFVMSVNGNSAFNPQKIGARPVPGNGTPKPPKAPEKPLMPYMRYSKKVWDSVKSQNPSLKFVEIGKLVGQMWNNLSEAEKSEFIDEYQAEKQDYDQKMAAYKNTPAYQAYMQAKSKGAPIVNDPNPRGLLIHDRRIDITPAEDEDDLDDGLNVKLIAHARYVRNHSLINEIFSEALVPDVRNVVTTSRMQVLKRQVTSLTMHQKKLEAELTQLEEKYNEKKRKLEESSELFGHELKKHCEQTVDEKTYNDMVTEQVDKLRGEREERARTGAASPPPATAAAETFDDRNILKPVENGDDTNEADTAGNAESVNMDNGEKTETTSSNVTTNASSSSATNGNAIDFVEMTSQAQPTPAAPLTNGNPVPASIAVNGTLPADPPTVAASEAGPAASSATVQPPSGQSAAAAADSAEAADGDESDEEMEDEDGDTE